MVLSMTKLIRLLDSKGCIDEMLDDCKRSRGEMEVDQCEEVKEGNY